MLETGFAALAALVVGGVLGWSLHPKSATSDADVGALRKEADDLREKLRVESSEKVEARTRLETTQARFEEEKARLTEIRKEMENSFKAMAAEAVRNNSSEFLKTANESFKKLHEQSKSELSGKEQLINKSLTGMNEKLETLQKRSSELKSSIDTSHQTTQKLTEDTAQLRKILSSSQQRGQWGERMVTDILSLIGLKNGINYTQQKQVESGERPDFTFLLPSNKRLNMDVKFPLARYENYLATEDEAERASQKAAFLVDVRKHVKTLSSREYINPGEGTLNYVMMFIPNESIYGFINSEDSMLVDYALEKRVLLCSPLTLYAVLSLIHQAARTFVMNERASEVLSVLSAFRNQWQKYVKQMDTLENYIEKLSKTYEGVKGTRTRQLDRALDKIDNIKITSGVDAGDGADASLPELEAAIGDDEAGRDDAS